jgi:D-glycerate 3-kinase
VNTLYRNTHKSFERHSSKDNSANAQQQKNLYDACLPLFHNILEKEELGEELLQQFQNIYLPFAQWVASKHKAAPVVIGINGAPGSGKSTLCKIIKPLLSEAFDKSVIHLSIDDLYFSRHYREKLANKIHPLFDVRGVPGTHDIERGKQILMSLTGLGDSRPVVIPKFDKASDDLTAEKDWLTITHSPDIILFEGWCVGSQAQHECELIEEINELEKNEDPYGTWRNYVNRQLAGPYQSLFNLIDYMVMLKVPDMNSVFEWRNLQEKKLQTSCKQQNKSASHLMGPAEIRRFIMHYERITRATLHELPGRADIVFVLNKQHRISNMEVR